MFCLLALVTLTQTGHHYRQHLNSLTYHYATRAWGRIYRLLILKAESRPNNPITRPIDSTACLVEETDVI